MAKDKPLSIDALAQRLKGKRANQGKFGRVFPVPEILDEGKERWHIRPSNNAKTGMINKTERLINVPLLDTPGARRLRNHEMAHLRFSPDRVSVPFGTGIAWVQACEDMRLHRLLKREKINMSAKIWDQPDAKEAWLLTSTDELVARYLAYMGTGDEEWATEQLKLNLELRESHLRESHRGDIPSKDEINKVLEKVRKLIWDKENPTFRNVEEAAKLLTEIFGDRLDHEYAYKDGKSAWRLPWEDQYDEEIPSDSLDHSEEGVSLAEQQLYYQSQDDAPDSREYRWGTLSFENPPLTEKLNRKPIRRKRKIATPEGAIPRRMHRLLVDQQCFTRNTTEWKYTGSILIDGSGSMNLSTNDIQEILHRLPGAVMGIYGAESRTGILKIIAENGMHCREEDIHSPGNANVVDGPSLEWLLQQPEPRVWITDGIVTGIYDQAHPARSRDCLNLCRKGNVTIIDDLSILLSRLKG